MVPKEYPPTMQSNQVPNTSTTADYQYNWCPHKLPCGWCSYMSRPCVKGDGGSPTITWTNTSSPITGAVHGGEV